MFPQWRGFINNWGFQRLEKPRDVENGNRDLHIGEAETASPFPILLQVKPPKSMLKMSIPTVRDYDQLTADGLNRPIDLKEFPNTGYMGDALGEF